MTTQMCFNFFIPPNFEFKPTHIFNKLNMLKEYKYKEITGKIIGAAMQVHKVLGNGFQEVIYQRALRIEMRYDRLNFKREIEMPFIIVSSKYAHERLIY